MQSSAKSDANANKLSKSSTKAMADFQTHQYSQHAFNRICEWESERFQKQLSDMYLCTFY